MAWTVNTFSGTYMGGSPSNARTAMYELCRAVNQREDAVVATKTTFYTASGTLKSYPTMADLYNMKTIGTANYVKQNLVKIQNAIVALVSSPQRFTVASGASTLYTQASLEAAIGTNLSTAPTGPTDARFWQAQKDALDLLIYSFTSVNIGIVGTSDYRYSDFSDTTKQDSWDALSDTVVTGDPATIATRYLEWNLSTDIPETHFKSYELYGRNSLGFSVPAYDGTLADVVYNIQGNESHSGCLNQVMPCRIGLATFDVDASTDGVLGDTSDITVGATNYLDWVITSTPSIIPISGTPTSGSPRYFQAIWNPASSVKLYFDIASVLDDQA